MFLRRSAQQILAHPHSFLLSDQLAFPAGGQAGQQLFRAHQQMFGNGFLEVMIKKITLCVLIRNDWLDELLSRVTKYLGKYVYE